MRDRTSAPIAAELGPDEWLVTSRGKLGTVELGIVRRTSFSVYAVYREGEAQDYPGSVHPTLSDAIFHLAASRRSSALDVTSDV